jgi:hypothetical protein
VLGQLNWLFGWLQRLFKVLKVVLPGLGTLRHSKWLKIDLRIP